jgi:glutamate--cysteine ligase
MAVPGSGSAPCRRCGSGCSTIPSALDAAWDLVRGWSAADRDALRADGAAPRAEGGGPPAGTVQDVAREVVAIARAGLSRRRRLDRIGGDESHFINVLQEIADSGRTPAEAKLEAFHTRWHGSVDPVFREFAY